MSKGRKTSQAAVGQKRPEAAHCAVGQTRSRAAGVAVGLTLSKATHNFILLFYFRFLFLPFSFVLVRFASVRFCFASHFNVSLRCERSERKPFFRFEAKKIPFLYGFVSLLSETERRTRSRQLSESAIPESRFLITNIAAHSKIKI